MHRRWLPLLVVSSACVIRKPAEVDEASLRAPSTHAWVSESVSESASASAEPSQSTVVQSAPTPPRDPFTLADDLDRPIEVYPPLHVDAKAPLVVVLHATCMKPASVCDWFGSAGRDSGWLVCPSGNSTCYGEPD